MKKIFSLILMLVFALFLGASTSTAFEQGAGDHFSHILNDSSYKAGESVSVRYTAHDGYHYDGQILTDISRWEGLPGNETWKTVDTRISRTSISDTAITNGFSFTIEYGSSIWKPGKYRVGSKAVDSGYGGWNQIFAFKEVSFFTISGAQFAGLVGTQPQEAGRASKALLANPNLGCDGKLTFPAVLGAGTDKASALFYQDLGENQVLYRTTLVSKPSDNVIGLQTSTVLPNNFKTEVAVMVHIIDTGNPNEWVATDSEVFNSSRFSGDTCYQGSFSR